MSNDPKVCNRCGTGLPAQPIHRTWVEGQWVDEWCCYQCMIAITQGRLPNFPEGQET